MNIEISVLERYSEGARERQESLCCPVSYDTDLLAMLPDEIIERDYGCGDPSRYVQEGDVVLDLGSGGGKICYMAAQLVGEGGQVIGVDMNDDMLALARSYQDEMAQRLCGDRVRFVKAYIQDLALNIDELDGYLATHPVNSHADYAALRNRESAQRRNSPLIADNSVDLVISNCVLNLVADHEKQQLLREIFRVLKPGGRVAIADIVSDRPIPQSMKDDPELWSGCISGAFQETEFLDAFTASGFMATRYDKWDSVPWQTVNGIEFRSVTLTAIKPAVTDNPDNQHTVIYRGPFVAVTDEAGNTYQRGQRTVVPGSTHTLLTNPAYDAAFIDLSDIGSTAGSGCCSTESSSGNGCC
ncbi:MAG: methyltransferase domain-containing protein [Gammaproteobacteria bacterium]|jgi:ubiquinone/menaquinone biosynthesis C-methylase UbiE